ncbi:MAG TPA: hypothetical protein VGD77_08420 [Gemmatimonadaceae bacterium]
MKIFSLAVIAIIAVAPVAAAQVNGSDNGGVITTGSGIAGGIFVPMGAGTASVPVSAGVASAISGAATTVQAQLSAGSLTNVITGSPISAGAQANVLNMMAGSSTPEARAAVLSALQASGAPSQAITVLMQNITNLLTNPTPGQVQAAVVAFNEIVKSASAEFLANAPGEFQAIHAALQSIVTSAARAR